MTNTPDELIARREVHIAVLKSMKDRTPVYMGEGPKPEHYQRCHAAFDAAIAALASSDADTVRVPRMTPEAYERAPKHRYWGAGEADCPKQIKAGNGELHTLRCKVCGLDNPRNPICHADKLFEAATHPKPEPVETPINMLLYCPKCGSQHIDWPDDRTPEWDNPPHRSHLCHACGCIWRPADVPTNGVAKIETVGRADTWGESNCAALAETQPEASRSPVSEERACTCGEVEGEDPNCIYHGTNVANRVREAMQAEADRKLSSDRDIADGLNCLLSDMPDDDFGNLDLLNIAHVIADALTATDTQPVAGGNPTSPAPPARSAPAQSPDREARSGDRP